MRQQGWKRTFQQHGRISYSQLRRSPFRTKRQSAIYVGKYDGFAPCWERGVDFGSLNGLDMTSSRHRHLREWKIDGISVGTTRSAKG